MTNIIGTVYDNVKTLIEDNLNDYIDSLNENETDNDVFLPQINDIYREYIDPLNLPTYPAILFEYGSITFDDNSPTTHERWIVPLTLYVCTSGAQSSITQKQCEGYVFALSALMWGEGQAVDIFTDLIVNEMRITQALMRENQTIQAGYIDLNVEIEVLRDQI